MSKPSALVERWDAYLLKINERFVALLTAGRETVLGSLTNNDYDFYASYRTLTSIKMQLMESLIQQIDHTWSSQVESPMRLAGDDWPAEMQKGYQLAESLHAQLDHWVTITEGELSQLYFNYALELVNKKFHCAQCNAPIRIKTNLFRSHYITCGYCNAVNTFVPETKYAIAGYNVVDNISRLHAFAEWQEYKREGTRETYRAYLEKYFTERMRLMPDTAATFAHDLEQEIKKQFDSQ